MDIQFGVDLSHHKPGFDFDAAFRDGVRFSILKATDGSSFVDPSFSSYLSASRAAGLLTAAYHYQQAAASVASQVALVLRTVPPDVPLAVDVERGSGSATMTRAIVSGLVAAGRRVILTYLPRWYWKQVGSPSLVGLPPLWSSRYPDNAVGGLLAEYADIDPAYWEGYGGLDVPVLQFSSSVAVANYTAGSIDASAFRGTLAQLTAFFDGSAVPLSDHEETDMPTVDLKPTATPVRFAVALPGPAADPGTRLWMTTGWGGTAKLTVFYLGEPHPDEPDVVRYLGPEGGDGHHFTVQSDLPGWAPVPDGTVAIQGEYVADQPGSLAVDFVRKPR